MACRARRKPERRWHRQRRLSIALVTPVGTTKYGRVWITWRTLAAAVGRFGAAVPEAGRRPSTARARRCLRGRDLVEWQTHANGSSVTVEWGYGNVSVPFN
ncbi:hypothetical protein NP493_983g00030 [Ridgeia piscesae]|uniref:Uncharacterized protein n=1 Tax=Ridgeia piscesae TaxID=27915 RepID=A0AAD9KJC7_RIDPI|nr:hypothetical protein NP493_983g00030 [Ridgeia piscesae]